MHKLHIKWSVWIRPLVTFLVPNLVIFLQNTTAQELILWKIRFGWKALTARNALAYWWKTLKLFFEFLKYSETVHSCIKMLLPIPANVQLSFGWFHNLFTLVIYCRSNYSTTGNSMHVKGLYHKNFATKIIYVMMLVKNVCYWESLSPLSNIWFQGWSLPEWSSIARKY